MCPLAKVNGVWGTVKFSESVADLADKTRHAELPWISISPPEIISHAVWLYHRFGVSFRDVEDLLAQRGLTVHESRECTVSRPMFTMIWRMRSKIG